MNYVSDPVKIPDVVVYRNGDLVTLGQVTLTHLATGLYAWQFTFGSPFEVGDRVSVVAAWLLANTSYQGFNWTVQQWDGVVEQPAPNASNFTGVFPATVVANCPTACTVHHEYCESFPAFGWKHHRPSAFRLPHARGHVGVDRRPR